mmetsp:Transcript_21745/g.16073  ORF Transcript_21745/g.16073 Transcript_21745/m.16073 type:complete len:150 (-) Transcript_21745:4693-5142(-)
MTSDATVLMSTTASLVLAIQMSVQAVAHQVPLGIWAAHARTTLSAILITATTTFAMIPAPLQASPLLTPLTATASRILIARAIVARGLFASLIAHRLTRMMTIAIVAQILTARVATAINQLICACPLALPRTALELSQWDATASKTVTA